jgi:hypothetical protein
LPPKAWRKAGGFLRLRTEATGTGLPPLELVLAIAPLELAWFPLGLL